MLILKKQTNKLLSIMKKVILSLFLVLSVTLSFAQKKNVSKAKNLTLMENPDFAAARAAILPALTDSTTMNDAATWHVAGTIGYKENDAFFQKMVLGQKVDQAQKGKALMESYNYFLKAYALDSLPNEKGKVKPRFTNDVKAKIKEYFSSQANFVGYGAHLFEVKDYAGAVDVFETYLNVPSLPIMKGEKFTVDSTYKMIKYYTAIACTNGKLNDKAIFWYEDLKDDDYEALTVHQLLYEEYKNKQDTAKFVQTLKDGFEKFPAEPWFLQNLINYYIFSNKTDDAMAYLTKAIERQPNTAQYHFVLGNLEESRGNTEKARVAFDQALKLDSTLADAWAGIGRIYFNKAVKMADDANNIKENKAYLAAKKKADNVFIESIPYFQKASLINPEELEYKRTLRTLYYRLKMDKEYDAVSKELGM